MPPREQVASRIRNLTARFAEADGLDSMRASFEAAFDDGGPLQAIKVAGRPAAWIGEGSGERAILYCHGGGYQIGTIRSHRKLAAQISEAAATRVLSLDYRLAPEHRFPCALDDVFAAYKWLVQEHPSIQIAVAGDSAGGALALGTALIARDKGFPMPQCVALISPWLDLEMQGESYWSRADFDIFSKPDQLKAMARTYLGREGVASDPLASPVNADLTGLPPILVHAANDDITRDDSLLLRTRAEASDVPIQVRIWPEMVHHFQMFPELPETATSLAEIGSFLSDHLK